MLFKTILGGSNCPKRAFDISNSSAASHAVNNFSFRNSGILFTHMKKVGVNLLRVTYFLFTGTTTVTFSPINLLSFEVLSNTNFNSLTPSKPSSPKSKITSPF